MTMRYAALLLAPIFVSVASAVPAVREIRMEPKVAYIHGPGHRHALLVTAVYDDGSERDVSAEASLHTDVPDVVRAAGPAIYEAEREGIARLLAEFAGKRAESVIVVRPKRSLRIDFALDVAPVFSKLGCNNTNCHGSIKGQKGFKLSLFGYEPDADYRAIVEDSGGRRIDRAHPDKSLLLLKPTFTVPHGGGLILKKDAANQDYSTLLSWIEAGAPRSAAGSPRLTRMEVFPNRFRVLSGKGEKQRIVVVGHYSDGSEEDISRSVRYTAGDDTIAVSPEGEIRGRKNGQATVLIRSLGQVAAVQVGVAFGDAAAGPGLAPANFIDELVFERLARMRIQPSALATDSEFIRRAYLDVIGLLPTVEEAKEFLADSSSDKRARLIDRLLARQDCADFWAMKWGDLFASNVFTVVDGTAYLQDWLREAFAANKPYDEFVRQVLTATGSTWDVGAVNFSLRPPEDLATLTAQTLLGLSIECARCHDHPSEKWKREDFISLTLADWIASPENPWFARATVNRFWRQLLGRGLVEPVDDFRSTNPATNTELLDRLAQDFIAHRFDVKHLLRTILNSRTYQLSSLPAAGNSGDQMLYSRYYLRRLSAEQLLDSLVEVTGVPEKFLAYYPGMRAVNVADPGIPSPFVDMYDRPKRDAAKCERNESVSLRQAMNMVAGETVNRKIRSDSGTLAALVKAGRSDDEVIEHFYLAALARRPSAQEKDACLTALGRAPSRLRGLQNVMWALLNCNEFLFNH